MSNEFEKIVLTKLDEISSRLTLIETKIEEATTFADSVLGGEGAMPQDGLDALKSTFTSLLNPGAASGLDGASSGSEPQDIGNLVSSLKSFQDRLSMVKDAMSDLPTQDVDQDK